MAVCSRRGIKRLVVGWTDKQLKEISVNKVVAEEKLDLCKGLIPVAEIDTSMRRRRRHSERRLSAACWDECEINLKIIPP